MGEIVIEIPAKANRRYKLTSRSSVKSLIEALDATAVRVRENPEELTQQQQEDLRDGQLADKIIQRNTRLYTQAEIERMLGA